MLLFTSLSLLAVLLLPSPLLLVFVLLWLLLLVAALPSLPVPPFALQSLLAQFSLLSSPANHRPFHVGQLFPGDALLSSSPTVAVSSSMLALMALPSLPRVVTSALLVVPLLVWVIPLLVPFPLLTAMFLLSLVMLFLVSSFA